MTNKLFEHTVLYDSGDAFFELKGNASMKLSPKAAIEVCNEAAKKGGNDSNLLIVFYVQIMPDDLVMQLHRF
ncbi:hypothetical protein [Escherichia coli]|uniref:hypothetical protein n=1 Tax=Escherichia coli TaxID=562 RepID=UPI000E1FD257|nr:hypothetical protein [Escherichia coli]